MSILNEIVDGPEQTSRARPFLTTRDGPLTVDFIRSELQHHRWSGDIFEALQFMIDKYDALSNLNIRIIKYKS